MTDQKSKPDLTRFVAIGDSITAGYADGALYFEGQHYTYPNLIAQNYNAIHPISFKQPLVDEQSVGIGFNGRSRLILTQNTKGSNIKSGQLTYMSQSGDLSIFSKNTYKAEEPFNNMAVAGAKIIHLIYPGYGNPNLGEGKYNSFFTRMASDPEKASILSDILNLDPTFFSIFIGNNDVLAYAMNGGTIDTITPLKGKPGEGFEETLNYIVNTLTLNHTKGILATIPGITTIPFFNTIPYNGLLLNKTNADALNTLYSLKNLTFKTGLNSFVIEELINGIVNIRQIKEGELILSEIMLDPLKDSYLMGFTPIPKKYTLTVNQISEIKNTITNYNKAIQECAKLKNLALVNLNNLLKKIKTDRIFDPKNRAIYYTQTGVFSLDGMHINSLGQALLANQFIKAIHKTYGLKIPRLPIFKFRKKPIV